MQSDTPMFFGAMNAGDTIRTAGDLARFLGGDADSFTGDLLHLIAKADPGNRERLGIAFSREVCAWQLWQGFEQRPTALELWQEMEAYRVI